MADQTQWEYRVQTIGGTFGAKDELIEATLNEWGEEGWELVQSHRPDRSSKVTLIAKRPLSRSARRARTLPGSVTAV